MALSSMTGFARTGGARGSETWYWEVKSVNGRGLDVRCRLPAGLEALEPKVRERVARHLARGNCQIALQTRREGGPCEVRVNEVALGQVLAAMEKVAMRLKGAPSSPEGVLALKGVLEVVEPPDEDAEARGEAMLADLDTALAALVEARRDEGAQLERAIAGHLDEIERLTLAARDCPERAPEAIRTRLAEQVARIAEAGAGLDEQRLHQEAMLLATKADVQEEIDRLMAHVAGARDLLAADEPAGRRLDFLTQEFNREANTLCAKAATGELKGLGLELKAVIDQMREQVQNVE